MGILTQPTAVTACSTLLVLILLGSQAFPQISIAAAGPIMGSKAVFGAQMRNGVAQAVADVNARGGVLGQRLVLEISDDACDPKQAVPVVNRIASNGMAVVVGHFCSSSSIPARKV